MRGLRAGVSLDTDPSHDPDPDVEYLFAPPRLDELLQGCGDPTAADTIALVEVLRDHAIVYDVSDSTARG